MRKLVLFFMYFFVFMASAQAKELPDFTELVEKQGMAVVNVSTTQMVHNENVFPQLPNMPEGDPFFDFFRRFAPPQGGPRDSNQEFVRVR